MLPGDVQDRDGAKVLFQRMPFLPRLAVVWADHAYTSLVAWVAQTYYWVLTTILRPKEAKGFVHLPKRWIAERTFGWFGRYRRLSKDYERNPQSSEAWILIAMIHRMSRQLFPSRDPDYRLPKRRRRRKRAC